ncbi:MAG TPA: sigma-70 family RNA polymerase sigma factor [Polyangiaceae bacterium]|nr:sigma-70 family RNA polymerase sigma factor [Polyangiaceae bacterium]
MEPATLVFDPLGARVSSSDTWSLERARAGDPRELEAIARRELPKVEGLLRRLLGPRGDMEDLVQNVFVEMCKSLPNFRGDSTISTFVGGIAVRVARRAMRPTAWIRFRSEMPEEAPAGPDRPHDNAIATEQLRRLDSALAKIGADKRIAFVLWAVEGKDVETIAKMVGASVPATRSRIHYAQKELRALASSDPYLSDLVEASDAG